MAKLAALWDWCMGTDPQWLYRADHDLEIHSFDHGNWLSGETGWTNGAIEGARVIPYPLPGIQRLGLPSGALAACAEALRGVSRVQCVSVVGAVPREWMMGEADLATVASILYERREAVAERLDRLGTSTRRE